MVTIGFTFRGVTVAVAPPRSSTKGKPPVGCSPFPPLVPNSAEQRQKYQNDADILIFGVNVFSKGFCTLPPYAP